MSGYESFERELFASVRRNASSAAAWAVPDGEAITRPAGPRRRLRRSPFLAALLVTGMVGTAAAAGVLALRGEPSRPLVGTSPRPADAAAGIVAGTDRYEIGLYPYLKAGTTGWCSLTRISDDVGGPGAGPMGLTGGAGCGPAATDAMPLVTGSSTGYSTGKGASAVGRYIFAGVVGAEVAGVRLGSGPLVLTRGDPRLPDALRYVVITSTDPGVEPSFFGADGRRLAGLGTRAADRTFLPDQPVHRGLTSAFGTLRVADGLPVRASSGVRRYRAPAAPPRDPSFLTAVTATVQLGANPPYRAALLVNGVDPRQDAAALPGVRDAGGGVVVGRAPLHLSARRAGKGWLVVTGIDEDTRRRVLDGLTWVP